VRVALPAVSWRDFWKNRTGNEEQRLQRDEKEQVAVLPLESGHIKAGTAERADESPKPAAGLGR